MRIIWLTLFLPIFLQAQSPDRGKGFFDTDEPLLLTIVADLSQIKNVVGAYPDDHPGLLLLEGGDTLHVQIRTRGDFRNKSNHCEFPLLRVNFKKKEVKKTVFRGEDKLKLVTHCTFDMAGSDRVIKEFLAYKFYSLIGNYHFKTRLVSIAWVDSRQPNDTLVRPAFFIESDQKLAERYQGKIINIQNINPQFTEPVSMLQMAVFQYMIGNTDWSIKALHNIELLATSGNPPIAIPFDFDFSGLVDAPYASPAPHLPITDVKQRHYNGHCKPGEWVDSTLNLFVGKKAELFKLLQQAPFAQEDSRKHCQSYLDSFFRQVEKGEAREIFLTRCRNDSQGVF